MVSTSLNLFDSAKQKLVYYVKFLKTFYLEQYYCLIVIKYNKLNIIGIKIELIKIVNKIQAWSK